MIGIQALNTFAVRSGLIQKNVFQPRVATRFINSSALKITPNASASIDDMPPKEELQFGTTFAPHMLTISYSDGKWHDPEIVPYGDLAISPAASCLNYGMTCFEGMKAYRSLAENDSSIRLFRPDKNMERLSSSMERLSLPGYDFDQNELIKCIMKLLDVDQEWIPKGEGYSLYMRPNVIAMNRHLGLANPDSLLLYVCTSPVGPYYKSGFKPVRLWCESKYVRATKGGTGNYKIGGNYAPTMKPAKEALDRGFQQVLWLLNDEITEVGAMNVFFVIEKDGTSSSGKKCREIVTAPLERRDILPGVTRLSIIELVQTKWSEEDKNDPDSEYEYEMSERNITIHEVKEAVENGTLVEAFGAGTAAVVTPIECIHYDGVDLEIPATGDITHRAWNDLLSIQYGKAPDHPWSVKVET